MKKIFGGKMMAVACGAIAMVSCSNSIEEGGVEDLKQYQQEVYNKAFAEEFGTPARFCVNFQILHMKNWTF